MSVLCVTNATNEKRKLLAEIQPDIIYKDKNKVTLEDLKDVEVVFGNLPVSLLNQASDLRLVQLDSAGADRYADLRKDIILCNASGAYGEAISEHMLGATLMIVKNLARYLKQQEIHSNVNLGSVKTISSLNVMSIGMGDIGSLYAEKMHMLGAKVYGVRRSVHDQPDYVEELYDMNSFEQALPKMDVVAMSLPSTNDTLHFMNDRRLGMMKDNAVLINVGRGSAIDETALLKYAQKGKFMGVALDVTEQEPLPLNSPLWNAPNVYLTPHIAGRFNAEVTYDKVFDLFAVNLSNYINDKPLNHVVDRTKGY